jgi:hypothetical protein
MNELITIDVQGGHGHLLSSDVFDGLNYACLGQTFLLQPEKKNPLFSSPIIITTNIITHHHH